MPVLTYDQALAQLSSMTSVEDLVNLAKSVDASVGDSKLILYGGQVGDVQAWQMAKSLANNTTVKWIENTDVATFLNNEDFLDKLDQLCAAEGKSVDKILLGKDANGIRINNTSLWDDASARLVSGHTGDIVFISPNNISGCNKWWSGDCYKSHFV